MRTQSFILLGMAIILICALASVQSTLSHQNNGVLAFLRILGLLIGFVMVFYGTWQLRVQRAKPSGTQAENGERSQMALGY
jgi:hypothetical protein